MEGQQYRFEVDDGLLKKNARSSAFAVINAISVSLTSMERAYGMRPAELQIFFLIGLAGVQRVMRERPLSADLAGMTPIPIANLSGISRRQLAELTGLSREAVNRTVVKLMDRGLVMEQARGQLSHMHGSLIVLNELYPLAELVKPFVALTNELTRLGAVDVKEVCPDRA